MAFLDLFQFSNPLVVYLAVSFLLLILTFGILNRFFQRGISFVIAVPIALLASRYFIFNGFFGYDNWVGFVFALLILGVIFKLFLVPFFKQHRMFYSK